jgi:polyhydroxyalkanoate synthase
MQYFKPWHRSGIGLGKVVDLLDHIHDEAWVRRFRRMERWVHDCPDQPAQFGATFLSSVLQQNCLMQGPFACGGEQVDLRQIRSPLLNIYGLHDHIVPNASSRALAGLTGSTRYTEIGVPTGPHRHVREFPCSGTAAPDRRLASPSLGLAFGYDRNLS